MSITPYEALAVAPKSQEASIFRTSQIHKENAQQSQIAGMVQQQSEKKLTRTEKATESEAPPFKFDAKEKGNNEYFKQQQRERKKKEEQESEERKRMLGCTFDITV